jgi:GT2 family glycosyltransferase
MPAEKNPADSAGVQFPAASLIICSRNRPTLLRETLESILAGEQLPAELIVIDQSNGTHLMNTDGLGARVGCRIRYIQSKSTGLSRAMNEGIRAATSDILVFTHDDVLVPPGWFGAIVRQLLRSGRRAVITGRVMPGKTEASGGFVPNIITSETPAVYQGRVWADVLYPLNMAMHREVLSAIGPFDERLGPGTPFPGAEDNDFGFRVLERGYSIEYAPSAALEHRAWRPGSDYVKLRWAYGRAQGAFYAKHRNTSERYIARRFTADLRHRLRRLMQRKTPEFRLATGDIAYVLGLLTGAAEWLLRYCRPWSRSNQEGSSR